MRFLGRTSFLVAALSASLFAAPAARSDELPKEYQETVKKGLAWMAKSQFKDGHWEGVNGSYAVSMTALGGMSMLCEGSTIREGKYRDNIRRAANWLMDRVQPNGLIGVPGSPT